MNKKIIILLTLALMTITLTGCVGYNEKYHDCISWSCGYVASDGSISTIITNDNIECQQNARIDCDVKDDCNLASLEMSRCVKYSDKVEKPKIYTDE